MLREEVIMVCCSDISGQLRGKGFPAQDLEARKTRGVGWTPTNLMITAHGPIGDSPWGPLGDLVLLPDLDTHVRLDFDDDGAVEQFILADVTQLDGNPWECCLRDFARRGIAALADEFGLRLTAAFEHEFHYDGVAELANAPYNLDAFRRQGRFAEIFTRAMRQAGLTPDTFMPEFGPAQYEVTMTPAAGLRAADEAVILREVARASAHHAGARASFTPILRPDAVGNGVHVHFSLAEIDSGRPVNFDADGPGGVSKTAGAFIAGILQKLPALAALTAASTISYLRLKPNRWSAAYNNLGLRDREAAVRICPVFETSEVPRETQYHFEYRAADAAASPYVVLGAIVWAGLHGLRQALAPPLPTETNVAKLSDDERAELGLVRLPTALDAALDCLAADRDAAAWMGETLHGVYLTHKRFEIDLLADLLPEAQCERYHLVY
ncbi:MAG: glutamine synthetase family protein [Alphaproteobacteria bacterium]|jgi:glutamine synthetase|nr:glutamine synthetase family protein [Alphaproteobacteria bacterium]